MILPTSTETFDVDLSELRNSIAAVLREECARQEVHAFTDGQNDLARRLWKRAAELGWLAIAAPEQYGGLNLGPAGLSMLCAELGRALAPGPFVSTLTSIAVFTRTLDEAFNSRWIPSILSGDVTLAIPADLASGPSLVWASGEHVSGTVRCLGELDARLLLAPLADARWVVINLADTSVRSAPTWDRTRSLITVDLERCRVLAMTTATEVEPVILSYGAIMLAADCQGMGWTILEQTIDYLKAREQFQRPIASFQAIKHRAADLVAKLALVDSAVANATESMRASPDPTLWALLAKAEAGECASQVARECLQLHGGVGFTWEFDVHLFLKRAMLSEQLLMSGPQLRDEAALRLAIAVSQGNETLDLAFS